MLGNNFLKKNFTCLLILKLKFIDGLKYFFVKKIKNINCVIPAKVTA